jgi:hypothetical protein
MWQRPDRRGGPILDFQSLIWLKDCSFVTGRITVAKLILQTVGAM